MPQILKGRLVGNPKPCGDITNLDTLKYDSASLLLRCANKLATRRIPRQEIEGVLGLLCDDLFYLGKYNMDRILQVTSYLYALNREGKLQDYYSKLQ